MDARAGNIPGRFLYNMQLALKIVNVQSKSIMICRF